jgi:hypothetical protein
VFHLFLVVNFHQTYDGCSKDQIFICQILCPGAMSLSWTFLVLLWTIKYCHIKLLFNAI